MAGFPFTPHSFHEPTNGTCLVHNLVGHHDHRHSLLCYFFCNGRTQFTYGGDFGKGINLSYRRRVQPWKTKQHPVGKRGAGETEGSFGTSEPGFEHWRSGILCQNRRPPENTICTFEPFHPTMQTLCHCCVSRAKINITLLLIALSVAALATCRRSIWSRSAS